MKVWWELDCARVSPPTTCRQIRPVNRATRLCVFSDILDMKPKSMEELTEVITAAKFHPSHCNVFLYSSSRGSIKMGDMRASALCDKHAKGQE